eukprot:gene12662-13870_t
MTSFLHYSLEQVAQRIHCLYQSYGEIDYIGEPVSILEHSLQGGYFARREKDSTTPLDEEFILAALFHDIGHVLGLEAQLEMKMGNCGIMHHEDIGGDFLYSLGFSRRVSELVRNHVQAKRYLCYSKPEYYNELSEASKTTLRYQGGPMGKEEGEAFERNPLFSDILLLRKMDEAAKVEKNLGLSNLPRLEDYSDMIKRNLDLRQQEDGAVNNLPSQALSTTGYILSSAQVQQYHERSFLKVTNLLNFHNITIDTLRQWILEIVSWPKPEKHETKWLMHYELSLKDTSEKILCRVENYVNYHLNIATLTKEMIGSVVSQLFHEESILFKEKINFKLPGGGGFACHQDTPAYLGFGEEHISVMVAIDDATIENGALEFAPGQWRKDQVHLTKDGIVVPEEEAAMNFHTIECKAGDIVFFSGYIPHRSKANYSNNPRRAMFLTFNKLSEGDFHDRYYQAKHAKQYGFDSNHAISFQNDFQGTIVD